MKIYLRGVFLVTLFTLFYFPSLFSQIPALGLPGENVPGELIVMFHSETEQDFIDDFERNHLVVSGYYCNLKMEKVLSPLSHIYLFTYNENYPNIDLIVNVISDDVKVEAVQFNHYVEDRETIPNDPSLSSQWHHIQSGDHDIDSDLAWDITTGGVTDNGDRIVVCVLEGGGANYSHVDLISNHWTNELEIDNNGIDDDENGEIEVYKKSMSGTSSIQEVDDVVNDIYSGKHELNVEEMQYNGMEYAFEKHEMLIKKDKKLVRLQPDKNISLSVYIISMTLNNKINNMPKPIFKFIIDDKQKDELKGIAEKLNMN